MVKILIIIVLASYGRLSNHCALQAGCNTHHKISHSTQRQNYSEKKCCYEHNDEKSSSENSHPCGSEILCCNTLDALIPSPNILSLLSLSAVKFLPNVSSFFENKTSIIFVHRDHGPPWSVIQNILIFSSNPRAPPFFS